MAAKGTKVTEKEKKHMWELFQEGMSFKQIGKKMRRSPDTVSRYVREYEAITGVTQVLTNDIVNITTAFSNKSKDFTTIKQK